MVYIIPQKPPRGLEPRTKIASQFYTGQAANLRFIPKKYALLLSREEDSNLQPMVYKTIALPLSYPGIFTRDFAKPLRRLPR